ncbi:L-threonylcarbamoyladenylate synthase [Sphingomonas sp.]|uniref:L-threonylcarbamoyladenylate synthase n=1 Tax=Sphingomonas sp. TaxID=28214 RepID=UPI0025FDD113|nr:L-threonylcarbamoyladenylate synthase [Sphingomonas sp.]
MLASNHSCQTTVGRYGPLVIADAAALIRAGFPVAVATETVYGLAADSTNSAAVVRIYEAKGRPIFNPLIIHVLDLAAAEALGVFNDEARALALKHWPGPLTLVVPRRSDCPVSTLATAGLDTIAIRVPAHRAIRALLEASEVPLAAPSANASGRLSPTRAEHVLNTLNGRVRLIIDDGPNTLGIESTIVAVDDKGVRLLRLGPIMTGLSLSAHDKIESPGQTMNHYAPSKELRTDAMSAGNDEWHIGFGTVGGHTTLSQSGDLVEAAANLFDRLHEADRSACATIAVAPVPETGIGAAINDRLRRACAANAGS